MNHRSHENTDHDYNTGIPLPMYVVDGQSEVERLREALRDMVYQFAYETQKDGHAALWTGGMSVLEGAFEVLGLQDPHIDTSLECDEPGCSVHASAGFPTAEGYRHTCHEHYLEYH